MRLRQSSSAGHRRTRILAAVAAAHSVHNTPKKLASKPLRRQASAHHAIIYDAISSTRALH